MTGKIGGSRLIAMTMTGADFARLWAELPLNRRAGECMPGCYHLPLLESSQSWAVSLKMSPDPNGA